MLNKSVISMTNPLHCCLCRVHQNQGRQLSSSATTRSLCSALYGNPSMLLGNPHLPPSGAGYNGHSSPHRRDSVDNSVWWVNYYQPKGLHKLNVTHLWNILPEVFQKKGALAFIFECTQRLTIYPTNAVVVLIH